MLSEESGRLVRSRLRRFALFDAAEYAHLHGDAGHDPLHHFIRNGIWERRLFVRSHKIASYLGSQSIETPSDAMPSYDMGQVLKAASNLDVGIYVSSRGNFFMKEIAGLVSAGLNAIGVRASLRNERENIDRRPRDVIFFAPHEFFELGEGRAWREADILSKSFMFATEQMQTPWFRTALPYILMARGVIDINFQTYNLFKETGMPALFNFPGFDAASDEKILPDHSLARALSRTVREYDVNDDVWSERPLDLVFQGSESPIREEFLARNARFLSGLECFIYYLRLTGVRNGPLLSERHDARPALNRYISRRAKIVLNLHQGEIGYFEWHRMVLQGIWQKAVVVSNPCLPHPIFKPNVHYLQESPRRIPALIEWLLKTADGRLTAERVRNDAFAALVEHASMRRMSLNLAGFLLQHRT